MFNGDNNVPLWDRLYLGGPNNLRGFKFRDVGPKDNEGDPIGGNTLVRYTIEYTIPVVERVRFAVFYDGGFVNEGSFSFSPKKTANNTGGFNQDVGAGIRLDLPIGPIRIDYGWPIEEDRFSSKDGQFQFSVGYQF